MNGVFMKSLFQKSLKTIALASLVVLSVAATAFAQNPKLQTNQLDSLSAKASQTVDVNIDERLIGLAAKFLGKDPDEKKVKEIVSGLKGIYVKSFEFKSPNAYTPADVEAIRRQVSSPGWTRVMSIREKNELAEIYFWKEGDVNGGLLVIAAEATELTVVNVVGRVDLATLSGLGSMIPRFPGVYLQK